MDLSHNSIALGKSFAGINHFNNLNIAFNNISVLKADDFVYLPQLRSLNISHSQITHIELGALSSFTRLDMLDLSNNRLKRIDFGLFIPSLDLTPLYLEGNDIVFPNLMSLAITSKASHWPYARRFLEFLMKNYAKLSMRILLPI